MKNALYILNKSRWDYFTIDFIARVWIRFSQNFLKLLQTYYIVDTYEILFLEFDRQVSLNYQIFCNYIICNVLYLEYHDKNIKKVGIFVIIEFGKSEVVSKIWI